VRDDNNIFRFYRRLTERSQREVAGALGRTQAWLSAIERNAAQPSRADAVRLADELSIPRAAFRKSRKP